VRDSIIAVPREVRFRTLSYNAGAAEQTVIVTTRSDLSGLYRSAGAVSIKPGGARINNYPTAHAARVIDVDLRWLFTKHTSIT